MTNATKATALNRLADQYAQYQSEKVLASYEFAALEAGATWQDIYTIFNRYKCEHGYYRACWWCKYGNELGA